MKFLLTLLILFAAIYAYRINVFLGLFITSLWLTYCICNFLPVLYQMKSHRFFGEGDYKNAKKMMSKAIAFKKNDDELKLQYSYIIMRLGEFEEAERYLNNLLCRKNLDKQVKGRAIINRCLCFYKCGNFDEAYPDATELFQSGFVNTALYAFIGFLKLEKNPNSKETMDFCLEAYDYADDDRDICDNLLMCYYNHGEYEKAKQISSDIIESNPKFVEAWYHAAQVDVKLNDYTSARQKLDKIPSCNRSSMTTIPEQDIRKLSDIVDKKLEVGM